MANTSNPYSGGQGRGIQGQPRLQNKTLSHKKSPIKYQLTHLDSFYSLTVTVKYTTHPKSQPLSLV